jgi:IS5 family transposase
MLRLQGGQVEALWDELLPIEGRELPPDLARLDVVLRDEALLAPIRRLWERQWPAAVHRGPPTLAMATYVRLMVLKQRTGWGYETLVREVSDSLHLRRFCLIALHVRVADESTLRKLTRRLGDEVVAEITRGLIVKAQREARFQARAMLIDSTVIEADVRYPSDAALAHAATVSLAREARRAMPDGSRPVRDRSRAVAKRLRQIGRTVARRSGAAKDTVLRLTGVAGRLVVRSAREARRLLAGGGVSDPAARQRLERSLELSERIARQIRQRVAGQRITDRVVSLADPDARPIGKGKLGKPYEFGYVTQLAEITEHTRRGVRGFLLPPPLRVGSPNETELLPATVAELDLLGLRPREAAVDGGFPTDTTSELLAGRVQRLHIAGRRMPPTRRARRRVASYRVGCEARIGYLKRRYGLRRTRLRGVAGARIWTAWAALAYNADTLALRLR